MLSIPTLLQATLSPDGLTENTALETSTKTISVIELLSDPGTLVVVIPLAIMSMIGVYVFIERYIHISKIGKLQVSLLRDVGQYIKQGNIEGAKAVCKSDSTVYAILIRKGILRIGKPLQDIKTEIESVAQIEVNAMEKSFPILATIAGVAPMLGFLGTVMGMVVTFHTMKVSGQAVKVDALSGGIMQALVTTIAGLVVGIIAYLAYNILSTKTQGVASKMEEVSLEFLDILQEPA